MKLRATHGFCIGGGTDVREGETFEATPEQARVFIGVGHAEAVPEDEAVEDVQPVGGDAGVVETRDPKPRTREPRIARGRD